MESSGVEFISANELLSSFQTPSYYSNAIHDLSKFDSQVMCEMKP